MAQNLTTASVLFLAEAESSVGYQSNSQKPASVVRSRSAPQKENEDDQPTKQYKWDIRWRNVIAFLYLHIFTLYGIYLTFTTAKYQTIIWSFTVLMFSSVGVTAGTHRHWCHRSYKAKWPLRLLLCIFQTAAFQNHIYEWVRDHRAHHKFTDTDADPHNSRRGFFFCHIGWLMVRKHPDVKIKGKSIDMSDIENDPIAMWQRRTYLVIMPLLCFVLPAWVPVHFWNEDPWVSWYVASVMRYTLGLNGTWLVNSAAHMWGNKPFDTSISAVENFTVSALANGEGWHNYHHVFPWDYKAAELGTYRTNLTTGFIDFFSRIGWAYDLKTVSLEMIRRRAVRTGDGSRHSDAPVEELHEIDNSIWGWGDKDMPEEDIKEVQIYNKCD